MEELKSLETSQQFQSLPHSRIARMWQKAVLKPTYCS